MAWLKIAFRNLVKNRRRSVMTAMAIALCFAALNLFGGFMEYMYRGNRDVAIYVRAQGHLTVFKEGFLEKGPLDPTKYLLTLEEMEAIEEICRKNPHVTLVMPQLIMTGLISNGKVSSIFIAQGLVPSTADVFYDRISLREVAKREREGNKKLEDDKEYKVAVSRGLARLLDLKVGSEAVAFATTVNGHVNALDLEVASLFNIDSAELNDKVMCVPLRFAQSLLNTKGADRMAILLDKTEHTEPVGAQLRKAILGRGLKLEIRAWNELNEWYRKVKEMFDVIFLFLFVIFFIIVIMSITNTMSMTVLERTREIGTLRALGIKRRGILRLFAMESSLLGVCGLMGGILLTFSGRWIIDFFKPTWTPPGITISIPLMIDFVPRFMIYSFLFLIALCLIASLIPARQAARRNIVDTLGHV
jgi:putative ABC transport system permease protein